MAGVEARFAHYLLGSAPAWALAGDQRFSYFTYVPRRTQEPDAAPAPLIVAMHGTGRMAESYRDGFADIAEEMGCVVLAPLFPCGIGDPDDMDNFKRIRYRDIRFDLVLLDMVGEVGRRYRVDTGRFLLHGFSGGGQFAHRFLYLHPARLRAVSIGAPGAVTLLDRSRDWWVGIRDVEDVFGIAVDVEAMRRVRVMTVIGADDDGAEEVTVPVTSPHWMEGANDAGANRPERIAALARSLEAAGVAVERAVIPGIAHEPLKAIPRAKEFFRSVLAGC